LSKFFGALYGFLSFFGRRDLFHTIIRGYAKVIEMEENSVELLRKGPFFVKFSPKAAITPECLLLEISLVARAAWAR